MRIIRKRTIIVWIIGEKSRTKKVKNFNNDYLNNISIKWNKSLFDINTNNTKPDLW